MNIFCIRILMKGGGDSGSQTRMSQFLTASVYACDYIKYHISLYRISLYHIYVIKVGGFDNIFRISFVIRSGYFVLYYCYKDKFGTCYRASCRELTDS